MDRRTARACAMKLVYENEMGGGGGIDTLEGILEITPGEKETDYMNLLYEGVREKKNSLDAEIKKYLVESWTLERIEGRIRNLGHEELFVLDADGNVIAAYRGNDHSVSFPATLLNEPGVTVTHGHPKSAADFGGTFSWKDIDNMLSSNWAEHRATASGQGEMNYIMRRTAKADPTGLRRQINTDYPRINKKWQQVYNDAYKAEVAKGTPKKEAMHIARQKGVGVLNRYYKDTFAKYGYEYITRKDPYKYNR